MFERVENMFATAAHQGHGTLVVIFIIGIFFGAIIQYSRVDKFEKIAGFAMLKDTIVPKMLFLAVGLASIGLYFMVKFGYAHYHIKPIMLGGLIVGGALFGISMAILGKCPGTGPISIAEGRIDVLVGAIGGLLGGYIFDIKYDFFKKIMGDNLGKTTLLDIFKGNEDWVILIFGIALVVISILIPKMELLDEGDLALLDKEEEMLIRKAALRKVD
ncbi:MAG: hypothetical protein DSZ06_04255 [Sulfurospirillum sp.]|nr:MAG: hypothetical protein DSZ06_04255 [Sulfurospirillum sp.]